MRTQRNQNLGYPRTVLVYTQARFPLAAGQLSERFFRALNRVSCTHGLLSKLDTI